MGSGTLRIFLFGEPRFEYANESWKFNAPPKTLPLLAYLLLHRSAPVQRERLATALWADEEPARSQANLRRHIHYLNKALPVGDAPWLLTNPKSIGWNTAAPYWLDVDAFELASNDAAVRGRAVRLYAGDLFERCAEEWMDFDRERLRTLQLSNLKRLCVEARERNAYLEALQYAQLMLVADPWREDAVRVIMEIRLLLHDRAGAIEEYESFAQRLRDELNTQPLEESTRLYNDICEGRASIDSHGAAQERAMIGRRNESATLLDEWQRAARGEGRVLFVGGEAGIGKSTLLESLCERVVREGAIVLKAFAAEQENAPYASFAQLVREAAAQTGEEAIDVRAGAALAHLVPELSPLPAKDDGASEEGRLQLFNAVANLTQAVADRAPLLIAFEDAHLAGNATLELLSYLALRVLDRRVLIVVTYREFEVGRVHPLRKLRRRLSSTRRLTSVALSALDRDDAGALVQARVPYLLESKVVDSLYRRSGGNPLFMIEIVREAAEAGFDAIPESVAEIVRRRLDRLDTIPREVLALASVAGTSCSFELLGAVAGLPEAELTVTVDRLVQSHFLRFNAMTNEVAFVHGVIHQAIYDTIEERPRRAAHARLAIAMRDLWGAQGAAASIARHFELGDMRQDAGAAHVVAAEAALRVYALDESEEHALRACANEPDRESRFRAVRVLETISGVRADAAQQKTYVDALLELSTHLPATYRAEALMRAADFSAGYRDGQHEAALRALEAFVTGEPAFAADYQLRFGEYLSRSGELRASLEPLRAALEFYSKHGKIEAAIRTIAVLYATSIYLGEPVEFFERELESVRERVSSAADARIRGRLAQLRSGALLDKDPGAAYAAALEVLAFADETDDLALCTAGHRAAAASSIRQMELGKALRHLRECEELVTTNGRPRDLAHVRSWQVLYENRCGGFDRAIALGEEGIAIADRARALELRTIIESNIAISLKWSHRLDRAEAAISSAIYANETLSRRSSSMLSVLAEIRIAKGFLDEGIALLEESVRIRLPQSDALGVASVHEPLVLGLAYVAAGRTKDAKRCAGRILSAMDRYEAYYFHPQAYLWAASRFLSFFGYAEAEEFRAAARRRYSAILAGIDDADAQRSFRDFVFNRLIVEDVRVEDPHCVWFSPGDLRSPA